MALNLYADECVDGRVVAGLRRRGADVVTAGERSLLGASDERQMEEAITLARVLVTADQDFLAVAAEMGRRGQPFPGVLFIKDRPAVLSGYHEVRARLLPDRQEKFVCLPVDQRLLGTGQLRSLYKCLFR